MIQPLRSRASARTRSISSATSATPPAIEDLVGRADVGAPVDVDRLVGEAPERAAGVEHHDDVVGIVVQALGDAPAGRDHDRPPDAVERDAVARRERLHAADAGDDLVVELELAAREDLLDDRAACCRRAPDRPRRGTRRTRPAPSSSRSARS